MKGLIKRLVEATGPSGFEEEIRSLIQTEVESIADDWRIDSMGNLIVRKGTKGDGGKRIMIAGHMDEIGVMVTHIDENGFIRFTNIGGVYPRTLPGSRVRFLNGSAGVIHLEPQEDSRKLPDLSQFYIDVGAKSRDECPIKVGDAAVFWRNFEDMGSRLVSKAMDDRIAVAIMIEAIKTLKETPNELYFVFTTQEEVGLRGATTSAYGIDPEIGIAVDVTNTGDTPKAKKMEVSLGEGPAIKVMDLSLVVDPRVIGWMERAAKKIGIPYQFEVLTAGGTDGGAINLTRSGVPAGCISVPTRYVHTPSEMVDYEDVKNCVKLLVELVSQPVELG